MSVSKEAYEDDQSLILFDPQFFTPGIREFLKCENEFIPDRIALAASVLEVGCGPGHYLEKLAPKTDKILGIDISTKMVALAKEKTKEWDHVTAMECAAEVLPSRVTDRFDVAILTWNTFGNMDPNHHVEILSNISQLVDGRIYLSVYRYGSDVVEERLAYYRKLGFPVEDVRGNDVIYRVGSGTILATAFTDEYYFKTAGEAGLSATIHNISKCGKIVECVKA
ncbi:MAG: class I SAM-dependent methyltransferase [Planctomycetota bacterium]|jgi:SAM-dependent methyltransferase|nr:class I SAM-dependent methyltransferase [Planctomycetota bacterium]